MSDSLLLTINILSHHIAGARSRDTATSISLVLGRKRQQRLRLRARIRLRHLAQGHSRVCRGTKLQIDLKSHKPPFRVSLWCIEAEYLVFVRLGERHVWVCVPDHRPGDLLWEVKYLAV